MLVVASPAEVREHSRRARKSGRTIGVIPTMGALHDGHVSLVRYARADCDFVIATIFVNPTQFGPNEDFSRYPRTLEADLELCRSAGADVVFTPHVTQMYGPTAQTSVRVSKLSLPFEGAHRPGHFDGVSTVVAKLFLITEPDRAYFGQKDYQQQLIIRQMVSDLDFGLEIVTCPIVREPDGLAMSSRNRYLKPDDRRIAVEIFQTLLLAESLARTTNLTASQISLRMQERLLSIEGIELSYAEVVDESTLEPPLERPPEAVALIAVRVGTTRLIDNMRIRFSTPSP